MKRIRWIITALAYSVATVPLYSQDDDIIVHLQTESRLAPLYLSHIAPEKPAYDKAYLDQLEDILRFDFSNNGATRLLDLSTDRESLAKRTAEDPGAVLAQWKSTGVNYVVVPMIREREIGARLLNLSTGSVKEIKGVALNGNLTEDRRQVHRLADTLHKELFGSPGIASTRILYTIRTKGKGTDWLSEVWESDYDGGNARQVTHAGSYCLTPTYLTPAAGKAISHFFYVGYASGMPRIFIASLKDGKGQRVTNIKGNQLMPVLSPQRDKIAYICDVSGTPDLIVQPYNPQNGQTGDPQQAFHAKGATESTPTFSPDGKEIAFTSDKDGSPRIYAMAVPAIGQDFRSAKPKLISRRAINGSAPAWSPDGEKIAFCTLTQGTRQIWVYDRTNDEETQITFGPGNKENASWAPDSLHLVYNTSDAGSSDLYLVDLNRMKPVKITSGKGDKRFPSWEPRGI